MKKIFTVTIVVIALIFSCKKKDPPAPVTNGSSSTSGTTTSASTTGGTTTGGTTTGGINGGPSNTPTTNATSFHSILSTTNFTQIVNSQTMAVRFANAYFTNTPSEYIASDGFRVGEVKLNGDSLSYATSGTQYATSFLTSTTTTKWEVSGANGIPSFTFNASIAEPTCTNLNLVPAAVSKSVGLSLSLTLSNFKTASLYFSDNSSSMDGTIVMQLVNGLNSINITPAQLNGMAITTNGQFILQVENNSNHKIGGKDISFKKLLNYWKQIEIKK